MTVAWSALSAWTRYDLWGPLTIVGIFLDGHAPWTWPVIGAASLCFGLLMFVYVRHDVKDFIASVDES